MTPDRDVITQFRAQDMSWHTIAKRLGLHEEYLRRHYGDIPRIYAKGPVSLSDEITTQSPKRDDTPDDRHLRALRATGRTY